MPVRTCTTPAADLAGLCLDTGAAPATIRTVPDLTTAEVVVSGPAEVVDGLIETRVGGTWSVRLPRQAGTTVVTRTGRGTTMSANVVSGGTVIIGGTVSSGSIISSGGTVTIDGVQVSGGGNVVVGEPVTVTVLLPQGCDLDVDTTSGTVDAHGTYGTVRHESSSGDLHLDTAHRVQAHVSSGDVRIGRASEEIEVSSSSGDVMVNASAPRTSVGASSGDVTVHAAGSHQISARASSGDVTVYRGGHTGAQIRTRTSSGRERVL